ncbi:MAG: hypothetical protein LCI02_23445 [Proteobacteria bacterium]|nr:hypothetical protein [Pseudomonadota bacterium]
MAPTLWCNGARTTASLPNRVSICRALWLHRLQHLQQEPQARRNAQRMRRRMGGDRLALHVFERQPGLVAVDAGVQHRGDVRVRQRAEEVPGLDGAAFVQQAAQFARQRA